MVARYGSDEAADSMRSRGQAFSSPEALEALLSTEAGRQFAIDAIVDDGRLDAEQAECLLDNLDFEVLAALAQGGTDPTAEMLGPIFRADGHLQPRLADHGLAGP